MHGASLQKPDAKRRPHGGAKTITYKPSVFGCVVFIDEGSVPVKLLEPRFLHTYTSASHAANQRCRDGDAAIREDPAGRGQSQATVGRRIERQWAALQQMTSSTQMQSLGGKRARNTAISNNLYRMPGRVNSFAAKHARTSTLFEHFEKALHFYFPLANA